MRNLVYQLHLWLGLFVSIPILAWALSGFLYALPNAVDGGTVEKIDSSKIKINPDEAMRKANELVGEILPTTALTLLMKNGKPVYQSIGGLGADAVFIDAETGEAQMSAPPTLKTQFFRQAHFYYFAGSGQIALLILFSFLACLSALTGIYLNYVHWFGGRRRSRNTFTRSDLRN